MEKIESTLTALHESRAVVILLILQIDVWSEARSSQGFDEGSNEQSLLGMILWARVLQSLYVKRSRNLGSLGC